MKIKFVKHYHYTDLDHKAIQRFANMVLLYIQSSEDNAELKLVNAMLNDKVLVENQMDKILILLSSVKERIEKAKISLVEEVGTNLPEHASRFSIVARPREFVNMLLENYTQQLKEVGELVKVLTTEHDDIDEDES